MRAILLTDDMKVIGHAGEMEEVTLSVDIARWKEMYPDGTGAMICERPDGRTVPLEVTVTDNTMSTLLPDECLSMPGVYVYTATWAKDGLLRLSSMHKTIVQSIGKGHDHPHKKHAETPAWATQILIKAEQIETELTDVINDVVGDLGNLHTEDKGDVVGAINEVYDQFTGGIAEAVSNWLDDHPDATTTVEDGSITKTKLDAALQTTIDSIGGLADDVQTLDNTVQTTAGNVNDLADDVETMQGALQTATNNIGSLQSNVNALNSNVSTLATKVDAMSAGRYNQMNYRWHVDCVNGNDNDTGYSGHAWRTLDKFFSMANKLDGGRADIRCYLDTPGIYYVQCEAGSNTVFTGASLHITGGLDSDAAYDGKYIIRFLTTRDVKWYASHVNLRNVRIECPNSTVDAPFAFDGGNYDVTNCYINTKLITYFSGVVIKESTVKCLDVRGGTVCTNKMKTTITNDSQIKVSYGGILTYTGSISNDNMIVNSSYPAFELTAAMLYITQVYPETLGQSLIGSNSLLFSTSSRATSWQAKAGTLTNCVWITG